MLSTLVRNTTLGIAAAAVIAVSAACSSGGEASASPDHEAFAKCLTDNGVPAPPKGGPGGPNGPGGGPGGPPPGGPGGTPPSAGQAPPAPPGVDQDVWDEAMQACSSLAPAPPTR